MAPQSTLEQWRFVFWITFGVSIVRIIVFVIWGSAVVQPWNDGNRKTSPESGIRSQKAENDSDDQKGETGNTSSKRYDSEHLHDEIVEK